MRSVQRTGRSCSRASCRKIASKTLTYIYAESTAVLGPLATFAEPHAYDLCEDHAKNLTVPNGWTVIKASADENESGPTEDDLMAIADAVREVGLTRASPSEVAALPTQELGRRGHLRALPSN
jgi:hypothetical protein